MRPIDAAAPGNAGAQTIEFETGDSNLAVKVCTLDSLKLGKVDFIKLDVEGSEPLALQGASEVLAHCKPVIACEVNTLDAAAEVWTLMRQYPFSAYLLTANAFNPANFARASKNLFGYATETSLLFLPEGRKPPKQTEICAIQRVGSLADLAQAFLAAPRFGDETPFDRNPQALRERLKSPPTSDVSPVQRGEVEVLKRELVSRQEELVRTRADAAVMRAQRKQAVAQLQASSAELERIQAQIAEVSSRADALDSEIRRERENSTATREALEAELAREREGLAYARRALTEEVEQREALVRTLEQERQLAARSKLAFDGIVADERAKSTKAHQSVEVLRGAIRDTRAELARIEKRLRAVIVERDRAGKALSAQTAREAILKAYLSPAGSPIAKGGLIGRLRRRHDRGALARDCREIEHSGFFDPEWYLRTYPEVSATKFDPVVHYLLIGGYEGRNPSERFDSAGYVASYHDVFASGMNPLLHYLRYGRRELRRARGFVPAHTAGEPDVSASFRQQAPSFDIFLDLAKAQSAAAREPMRSKVIRLSCASSSSACDSSGSGE
jgi:hypothetical protein